MAEAPCPEVLSDDRIRVAGLISEVHHGLNRSLGAELEASAGMGLSTYEALVRLRRSAEGHLTVGELGRALALSSGYTTRLVDRLVEAGYAERLSCPSDRRAFHVAITGAGSAALDQATERHLAQLDELLSPLSCDERKALVAMLGKLAAQGA